MEARRKRWESSCAVPWRKRRSRCGSLVILTVVRSLYIRASIDLALLSTVSSISMNQSRSKTFEAYYQADFVQKFLQAVKENENRGSGYWKDRVKQRTFEGQEWYGMNNSPTTVIIKFIHSFTFLRTIRPDDDRRSLGKLNLASHS